MYETPWWYYCNLSACVYDWFLSTHEFCAFNFILKIGCDTELWFQQLEKTEACQISNSFKIHAFTLARIGLPWTYKVEDFRRTTCLLSLSSVHDWTLSSKLTAIFRAIKALVLHILSSEHCLAVQQLIKIPKPQINLQLAVQKWLPGI